MDAEVYELCIDFVANTTKIEKKEREKRITNIKHVRGNQHNILPFIGHIV